MPFLALYPNPALSQAERTLALHVGLQAPALMPVGDLVDVILLKYTQHPCIVF